MTKFNSLANRMEVNMNLIIYKMIKNEKGYAIAIAITVSLILFILGLAIIQLTDTEIKLSKKTYESAYAYYLAEAGVNHSLWLIGNQRSPNVGSPPGTTPGPATLGDGQYYVSVFDDVITSVGIYENCQRTITVRYEAKSYQLEKGYAVYAARSPSIPSKVYFYNATTDPNACVVTDLSNDTLNIDGYVFSTSTPSAEPPSSIPLSDLGYVWNAAAKYNPTGNINTHFRVYPSTPDLKTLTMSTSFYDGHLAIAKASGQGSLGSTTYIDSLTVKSGEEDALYYKGNVVVRGNVTADASDTPSDVAPALVAVYGTLTFDKTANVCPYVTFMAAGGYDTTEGNVDAVIIRGETVFQHNVEVYSRSNILIIDGTKVVGFTPTKSFEAQLDPVLGGSSFLAKNKIEIDNRNVGFEMNMAGIFWAAGVRGGGISVSTRPSGNKITIRGGLICSGGTVSFPNNSHLIKIYYRDGFRPSNIASAFGGLLEPKLIYSTWRE